MTVSCQIWTGGPSSHPVSVGHPWATLAPEPQDTNLLFADDEVALWLIRGFRWAGTLSRMVPTNGLQSSCQLKTQPWGHF